MESSPVMKQVGMSKINGLHGALCEKEGQLALYMLERSSQGPKRFNKSVPHVFPKPVSKVRDTIHAKVGSRLDAFTNRPSTSTRSRTRPPVACSA
ncbi:hypothetical protein TNCV_4313981 [Trichonephila clavipes]|nr:hypothetical protein TNCV_4313981 [Trichonephila clavipes]